MKLYLVACAATKGPKACAAKDLYLGTLFKASRALAEAKADEWYILSGLHGLISPVKILEPYEFFLGDQSKKYRKEWSLKVINKLGRLVSAETTILAGKDYWEFLKPELMDVKLPLEGLAIGKQIQWLQRELTTTKKRLF